MGSYIWRGIDDCWSSVTGQTIRNVADDSGEGPVYSIEVDMAKFGNYDVENMEVLCGLGKAISSPERVEILQLLYDKSLIIGEIARQMNLPASSTAYHLKILEQAGLIRMEEQPGTRGGQKLCTRKVDHAIIDLVRKDINIDEVYSVEMPVGAYSRCEVTPTCGLCTTDGTIGNEDVEYFFYTPQRFKAGMLWTSSGYVEYEFPNGVPKGKKPKKILISMEICSEAPGYREDWKSDITLWINGRECGTFTCPGDFGKRRGRLTPPCVANGSSQYGLQTAWEIQQKGTFINGEQVSMICAEDLDLDGAPYITVRIGNKPDAVYIGGFNLFGKNFGDYNQDIVLNIEY